MRPGLATRFAEGLVKRLRILGWVAVLLTVCGQLLGRLWWPFELASHFTYYYALALVTASVVCLAPGRTRRPRLGAACVACLLANAWLMRPYLYPAAGPADGRAMLRVMSLNVLTSNTSYDEVIQLVEQTDPDVLALIEVDRNWVEALEPLFQRYPTAKTLPRSDNFGVALLSKLHVDQIEVVMLAESEVPSVRARVRTPEVSVTVLATHPLPPIGADYARRRNQHLAAIGAWANELEDHAIVMGDLNVTPWSPCFRGLIATSRLRDSAVGRGLHSTWFVRGGLINLPIDHVLHTRGLEVVRRGIGPSVGSDHRAVIVDFALPSP